MRRGTRRLAARLGVRSPTLYWHVRDKGELLDLVTEHLCADAFDIDESTPWRTQVREGMGQFRRLAVAHPYLTTLLRDRPARRVPEPAAGRSLPCPAVRGKPLPPWH